MSDVEEIIDFIKSLKRGFDKDLFQSKIDELAHVVDSSGLEYEDFHTLFKVWLNLSIPITKWISLGLCLVPRERLEERTVDYAFRWLLDNSENHSNFSRTAFLLDWLTAAMDSGTIDMVTLNYGYEIFYSLLVFEVLTAHALKLIYNLTMPTDVTRMRVVELLDYAKNREGKQNMYKQIQVLLGLFKSYRPECVPENVLAVSIHTSFRKINSGLLARFKRSQENRNVANKEKEHLLWTNPLCESARNKKADPLVPNMGFANVGSKHYSDKQPLKSYLDFSDPVSLLHYSMQHPMSRPARFRALFCNDMGLTLLALASENDQAFMSNELHTLLCNCFLEASPHTEAEKSMLLRRLSDAQNTLQRGLPVVTRFLAHYLPLWDETHYFSEILRLVEWLSPSCPKLVTGVVRLLCRACLRAQPLQQCAILGSLSNMYANMVFESTRVQRNFFSSPASNYKETLSRVAAALNDLNNKALQISPDDMRVLYWCGRCLETRCIAEVRWRAAGIAAAGPGALSLALPLLQPSALLVDRLAALIMAYKKIVKLTKETQDEQQMEKLPIPDGYIADVVNILYYNAALSGRKFGFVFSKLHPQLVAKLGDLVPEADALLSIKNHLAFAPYAYILFDGLDPNDVPNKIYFNAVVVKYFPNLKEFLMKTVRELL